MIKNQFKNLYKSKIAKSAAALIIMSMLLACNSFGKEPAGETDPLDTTVTTTDLQDVDVTVPEDPVDTDEAFYDNGEWLGFDLKALGVKPRDNDASDNFELSENMKQTIANMYAASGNWSSNFADEREDWKDVFVQRFLLNSWYSPEYAADKDVITKEEAEYIQYSLTGVRLYFAMGDDEVIDRSEASSPFNETYMGSYTVSESDEGYVIDAEIITKVKAINEDGDFEIKDEVSEVSVILKENPYSCFDGYSIESITGLTEK